jgi:guanylate kinase
MSQQGRLVVLSGPSAVGKGTLASHIISNYEHFDLSVSATTRAARPGEIEGKSYFFVSEAKFQEMIDSDQLLEWATVHGRHRYGTPRVGVEESLSTGSNVVLEIDVQGAFLVKKAFPEALLIFVNPPSFEELEVRMEKRGTESLEDKLRRLETAKMELLQADAFDFQVVNDEVARCAQEVVDLVQSN